MGSAVIKVDNEVRKEFDELIKLEINQTELYNMFAQYLRTVIHDQTGYQELLDTVKNFGKRSEVARGFFKSLEEFEETSVKRLSDTPEASKGIRGHHRGRLCVFEVSAEASNMGEIVNVSSSCFEFLGYTQQELKGELIDLLMPAYYAQRHNLYMKEFFEEKGKRKNVMDRKRRLLILNKRGYLKDYCMHLKMLPVLDGELRAIAVISNPSESASDINELKMKTEIFSDKGRKFRSSEDWGREQETGDIVENNKVHYI